MLVIGIYPKACDVILIGKSDYHSYFYFYSEILISMFAENNIFSGKYRPD